MPVSDLQIVNGALSRLGIAPISAIGEDSEAGTLSASTYEVYRDQLLHAHPWNFATKQATLNPAAVIPPGWGSAFILPNDCLRVLEIVWTDRIGWDTRWLVQDGTLLYESSGETSLEIRYIYRVTQPGRFSAGFTDALMSKLAAEWAEPLTSSNTLMDRMVQEHDRKIRETRSYDGQEAYPRVIRHHSWTENR